jgi:hypothetical protein
MILNSHRLSRHFWGKATLHAESLCVSRSSLPTLLLRKRQPSKPLQIEGRRTSEGRLSLGNWWAMKVYEIYGLGIHFGPGHFESWLLKESFYGNQRSYSKFPISQPKPTRILIFKVQDIVPSSIVDTIRMLSKNSQRPRIVQRP